MIRRAPAPARMPMYMFGDTLVSLDYDLKTIKPLLAKSWTISEDGKTYTFKLRDDVTFCSGKKFTAEDVVYTVKRVIDKETKSPFTWRMGKVKEVRAKDRRTPSSMSWRSRSASCCRTSPSSRRPSSTRRTSRRSAAISA